VSALKICPQCGTEYELDQRFCPKDGSTLKTQNAAGDLVGSIIADRYHVLKKLGEGGMGTVYLAEHVKMGRKSAVKVMNPGMVNDADAISRFNREAANASKISHPNVAAVYDFGETSDGLIYLAMEFIEGPSLTSVIKDAGALSAPRAAEITRQASEALAVAHDMGIVHRDLKPDNIMLAKARDGADIVKVVDFGIAKAANNEAQKVTKTGLVVGTPEYMSPEQLAGDKLDGRSDTYSLALVSFNMLTGKLPFPGETVQESMIMRLTDSPRPLSEMKPDVAWPPQLQTVMDKALQRDAADRYQTAAEFGRDIAKAVQGMRASAATASFTAVVEAGSAPPTNVRKTPDREGGKTAPLPQTRVSKATPPSMLAQKPARNRTPMLAGIVVLVILLSGGAYMALGRKPNLSAATASQQSGDSTQQLNRQVASPPPTPLNLNRELEDITPKAEDSASAPGALTHLAQLESSMPSAPDSTFRQFQYLRAKALINSGSVKAGCDSLKNIEGKLASTRFARAAHNIIVNCP